MTMPRPQTLVLASLAAVLAGPTLFAQAFTFGAPQYVPFPSPAVLNQNAAMDMNGDGKTDLFVALSTGTYIYVGDGNGNFSGPVTVSETPNTYSPNGLRFFDVNGDGISDEVFAYAGFIGHPGVFAVLLGDGKGNYTQTTSIPQPIEIGGSGTPSLAVPLSAADFNHDGKLDFVTVYLDIVNNVYHAAVNVYLNQGGGVFKSGFSTVIPGNPTVPAVGDFNGDGNIDIAWFDANPQPGTNNQFAGHCLFGKGDGTFLPDTVCYTIDGPPYSVAAADFNHDGKTDLLVLDGAKVGVTGAKPRLATLLAKQSGGFYWASSRSINSLNGTPGSTHALLLMDMNGDGYLDVNDVQNSSLYAGGANGVFGPEEPILTNAWIYPFFAPFGSGQLPALIHIDNDDGDYSTKITIQPNTSPK